jgi:ribosomal protein S18 acetylase RimI-like enzyme
MRTDLAPDEPAPQVPEGITIRLVRHDDDAEMRAFHRVLDASFRDTPDYQPTSYETYRERLAALPGIDWDEWFVAEVDGDLVAVLQSAGQIADENEGWVKNLGVSKESRGRGLGRLLLQTAFHTYANRGRLSAGLGVDMTNPTGAYRLYESVGMSPLYEVDFYERRIEAVA